MRIFRNLTNSLISGIFFSLLIALLVANLNINILPNWQFYLRLTLFISSIYGLASALFFLASSFLIEFLFGRAFKIKLISPSFLSLSFSTCFLFFFILLRLNQSFYRSFFSPTMLSSLKLQGIISLVLILNGLVFFWRYHRHRPLSIYFILAFIFFFIGLGLMFWSRSAFPQPKYVRPKTILISFPSPRRATLLNLEGLSFNFLIPLIHEGKLPNFSWLMENGSWARLQTLSPTDPFVLKKSLLTGKNPYGHRCLTSQSFSFWGKKPFLEALPRFMLFKQLTRFKILIPQPVSCQPGKDIWQILTEMNFKIALFEPEEKAQADISFSPKAEKILASFFGDPSANNGLLQLARQALGQDISLEEKAFQEKGQSSPQVFALFLDGLNQVKTFFYKYSFPHLFGNIDQSEINRYGPIIQKYYIYYDQLIGKYLANLREDELLIIFSTHGMEPLPIWKRLVEWALGNPLVSGHFEFAPEGVIFFYGRDVIRGQSLEKVRLVDIGPTLLYLLGLPVARDMDGLVCSSAFRPEFSQTNPVFYISSYEEVSIKPGVR
ncbi:MAG: alkaline phosphatase family protein [Candidatus Aminicenantes bacterium]|nr:alkaline phosphatase family protein [Candidatus Aminicenantes bacterium]